MTPKEKAEDLFYKIGFIVCRTDAKECALIAVEEILNHHSKEQGLYRIDTYYWKEVKKEIEKL